MCGLGNFLTRALGRHECDLHLDRAPGAPRERAHLVELVDDADVHVPPVRMGGDQLHRSPPRTADHDGDLAERAWLLLGTEEPELLAFVVESLASPQGLDDLEGLLQPPESNPRLRRPDAEDGHFAHHRAPAEPELESPTGGVVERDRLPREHCRMAERVAEHKGADAQPVSPACEPCVRDHRIEHRGTLRAGRRHVVHARDACKPGRFGGACALHHLVHRHAHLRQVEPEFQRCRHRLRSYSPQSAP